MFVNLTDYVKTPLLMEWKVFTCTLGIRCKLLHIKGVALYRMTNLYRLNEVLHRLIKKQKATKIYSKLVKHLHDNFTESIDRKFSISP